MTTPQGLDPMKIAFIVTEFPSLSQTFVLNQITGLMDRGHDVEIFALKSGNSGKVHEDVVRYGLLERTVYVPEVPRDRWLRLIKGLKAGILRFPKNPGMILRALDFRKFGRQALSLKVLLQCMPFLDKGPFDIVQCHFGPCGILGIQCILTGALTGRLVTAFHGFDLTTYVQKLGKGVYGLLFRCGDLFLPISRHWRQKLLELGCGRERIVVHRMGVDTGRFALKKEVDLGADKIRLLSIGRLVEKKGIRYGIEAVSRILKRYENVEYTIAGDGPLRSELEQLAKDLDMDRQVRFAGWLNQEEVTRLMMESDILIAPSVTARNGDQEGIPVVLMEALAMGLPVVSTFHSGIPELVVDGRTGLLAPERDSEALAERIGTLIDDKGLVRQLRINGRRHVEEEFDIRKLNGNLESLYRRILVRG